MFQFPQGVDARHSIFNDVGRDQFNVTIHNGTTTWQKLLLAYRILYFS